MRIYLAARYSRREELCRYREQLCAMGHTVQARWLDGTHQISDAGQPIGDHGEALVEGHNAEDRGAELRAKFARDDYEDVIGSDVVISFTEPPRSLANRGGRHVEYGIALALGKRLLVVGHRENLFHWLPQAEFYAAPEAAFAACSELPGRETWECTQCGSPCRLTIDYTENAISRALKVGERFRKRACPCSEPFAEWVRIANTSPSYKETP
ncbi:MAG: hypothetical protein PHR35_04095 [Kiritimatiellae bacterium]|nr:hypothetical protein [Kiritimatiellia bacterium]